MLLDGCGPIVVHMWTSMNRTRACERCTSTLLTVDNSQPWTVSNAPCILGQKLCLLWTTLNCGPWIPFHGTKVHFLSLPWTVNSPQFFLFFFKFLIFTLFLLFFITFKVILVRSIFSFVSLYYLKLLERVSN